MRLTRRTIKKTEQKQSLVSPFLASLLSAILPGLGQLFARKTQRALVIMVSMVTSIGLWIWRVFNASRRYEGFLLKVRKAFALNPILYLITALLLITYLWIIYDAYRCAHPKFQDRNTAGVILLILLVFFIQGWEIGQIDFRSLIRDADEAVPALSRFAWPWQKAVVIPQEFSTVFVEIQAPCSEVEFPKGVEKEDEAYLIVDPTCGNPSEAGGVLGTEFFLIGENFDPDEEVEIWWKDPISNVFKHRAGGQYLTLDPDEDGSFNVQLTMPYRILPPVAGEGPKVWQIQARQLTTTGKAEVSPELKLAVEKMIETIIIGMMATLFGIILAVPVSFLAARNLMSGSKITMAIYYLIRTLMNIIRSIEPLIWAIIAVIVVGLGPFAGIVALTLHSLAALAKLYSEAIESIDPGPIEAIQATGANWLQTIMYAVVPQIIPPFVSFTIYRWDINIRMSTVIGFVGGGGIGYLLSQWISLLDYRSAGMAVWFIAITVAILDFVSADIRERFI
jgi:phosphonate transport system permease protein